VFEFAVVSVACERQAVAVACDYAVHNVMPSMTEQNDVAFAKRFCIAGRKLYFCPFVAYERTHTVSFDAHNDIFAVGDKLFYLCEKYVVAQYFHRNGYKSPKTVS